MNRGRLARRDLGMTDAERDLLVDLKRDRGTTLMQFARRCSEAAALALEARQHYDDYGYTWSEHEGGLARQLGSLLIASKQLALVLGTRCVDANYREGLYDRRRARARGLDRQLELPEAGGVDKSGDERV